MENLVKARTNLRAGQLPEQSTNQSVPSQTTQYTVYARSALEGIISSLQSEVSNLRVWSIIRMKGEGISDWVWISQKPQVRN
jgi:hypothetical protein